ncbi:hypothetical protein JL720_1163 [Aureococcus anophagefferens]|nr:hypothetical protein JL720_1163 [Aureococcus anophagefferens]
MDDVAILYINLDRSVRMEKQFEEAGISNFKRVPAFDGKKLFGDPKLLASTVELPSEMKQSSGEIGCSLSHLRAAEMALELDDDYVMVMEDDIHLTFYGAWRTTVKEIVSQAPPDWQVLQLTINNVRVLRTLLGLGSSFVPWRKNHWSTGAYLINRRGCQRAVDEFTRGPNSSPRYRLPANVQLVSDVLMYNGPGAYTHTRPLFDHEIKESTIHQGHVESCHRQASELGACFYGRLDLAWAGGDDCRAAVACVLREAARPDQRARLEWWLRFHLRVGFRPSSCCRGRRATTRGPRTTRSRSAPRRLAGASWLLRIAEDELLYVLPGRSLRSVFDEARRGRGGAANTNAGPEQTFNVRFDNMEVQKRASLGSATAHDSAYNFFVRETLFKRRTDHVDGAPVSPADDRAYYDLVPAAAQLRRLPAKHGAASAPVFLGHGRGRSAGRLSEPGLAPAGNHAWRAARGEPAACGGDLVSSRAFVLSFPYCHFDAWKRAHGARAAEPKTPTSSSSGGKASPTSTADLQLEDRLNGAEPSAFEAASVRVLHEEATSEKRAAALYGEHVLLPPGALSDAASPLKGDPSRLPESYDAADLGQHPPVVFVSLPPGCVRADCGGAYVRLQRRGGDDGSALYQQQGGAHHLYRISKPFVAWMVGRTPYSSTAALVAHDLALRPQDVRAPWSAFDGRRWATVPSAHVRLEQHVVSATGHRFAVVFRRPAGAPDYATASHAAALEAGQAECWVAKAGGGSPLGNFLTAEQAEGAVVAAAKRQQRENYLLEVRDSGAVIVDLPASCGAAADACAGVYVPHDKVAKKDGSGGKSAPGGAKKGLSLRVYRHEEGAHYLYFYAPFSAWMIGSRPGSGSAALIAYDGAERPELIAPDAPWRVYDGRAWREVSEVRIRALADQQSGAANDGSTQCALEELPVYAWTPKGDTSSASSGAEAPPAGDVDGLPVRNKKYLVYSCCGDRAVLPNWLKNGNRGYDLWPAFEQRGKVSHAMTAVQPANRVRLTNFIEMTCPLFSSEALGHFLDHFDPDLKGWGADWWFLTIVARTMRGEGEVRAPDEEPHPRLALRGGCGVCDAVSCINPTDADKSGVREINVLQGREGRRDCWNRIRAREKILEWDHLEFGAVWLTADARPDPKAKDAKQPVRIRGTRSYELAPPDPPAPPTGAVADGSKAAPPPAVDGPEVDADAPSKAAL